MQVYSLVFNPLEENTYIVADATGACLLIDPGCSSPQENERLFAFITQHRLHPEKMVLTHGHFDHFAGCGAVYAQYHPQFSMSEADRPHLDLMKRQGEIWGFDIQPVPSSDFLLDEQHPLTFGESTLQVLVTPGHSPGGLTFYAPESGFAITGDSLFQGSIGRTDLPGGDYDLLMDSLEQKILTLPETCRIYPGHGPESTLYEEKLNNPFLHRLGTF